jgi:DNA polymerase-1
MQSKIHDIYDKKCTQCNLGGLCKNPCIAGTGGGKLMIVLNYPSTEDDLAGKQVLIGEKQKVLHTLLTAMQIPKEDVFITYMVKCRADVRSVTPESIDTCLDYFKSEISILKPKAIIAIGADVYNAITGLETSLAKARQAYTEVTFDLWGEEYKVDVLGTYSPAYAMKLTTSKPTLIKIGQDIYKAYCKASDIEAGKTDTVVTKVRTVKEVYQLVEYVKQTGVCCFDFETTGLKHYSRDFRVTLLAISFQPGGAYTIPLYHFETPFTDEEVNEILTLVYTEIIQNYNIRKIGHNVKFDLHCFARYGFNKPKGVIEDTVFLHHLLHSEKRHGLKELVSTIFPQFTGYENNTKKKNWDAIPLSDLEPYGGADSDLTLRIWLSLTSQLIVKPQSYKVYRNIMIPALKTMFKYENMGIAIDEEHLRIAVVEVTKMWEAKEAEMRKYPQVERLEIFRFKEAQRKGIEQVTAKLEKWRKTHNPGTKTETKYVTQLAELKAGNMKAIEPLKFNSNTKLLPQLFYTEQGFNFPIPKDRWGKPLRKTGKEVIALIDDKTGFLEDLQEWRSLGKTLSTYLLAIQNAIDDNNRLHTNFHIAGTQTGRISSSNPNVQNITQPGRIKYPMARKAAEYIKEIFITPGKDWSIIQVDFSQMELRLIAWFAQCKAMLEAYANGEDLHALTAANVNGYTIEEFKALPKDQYKLMRYKAKAVNFGFIYGASAETFRAVAKQDYGVDFTIREARKIRANFFKAYPELLRYHRTQVQLARANGTAGTLLGSERNLPDIRSKSNFKKGEAERQSINTPIQGTSGQFTMFALALLEGRLDMSKNLVQGWNSVHDSGLYYIHNSMLKSQLPIIKYTCENLPIEDYFGVSLTDEGKTFVSMKVDFERSTTTWKTLEEIDI